MIDKGGKLTTYILIKRIKYIIWDERKRC